MAELNWTERSLADLENIYDYIARDSAMYARLQIERLFAAAERLRSFPDSGRRLPEYPGLPHREIILGGYRIIYLHVRQSGRVDIIAVVNCHQQLTRKKVSRQKTTN